MEAKLTRIALLIFLLIICRESFCQKNDTLTTLDGIDVIGEIYSLQEGKLEYATVYLGTAKITWSNIERLVSPKNLTISTKDGKIYHGALVEPDRGKELKVRDEYDGHITIIPMADVIQIDPVVRKRIYRIKGYLDLGFSYTKGSDVTQLSFNGLINYRTDKYDFEYATNTITHVQGKIDKTTYKRDMHFTAARMLPRKYIVDVTVSGEQNTELGIELRSIVGLGIGNQVLLRPRNRITLTTGPIFNNENYSDTLEGTSPDQSTVEWMGQFRWRAFSYSLPELQLYMDLVYYYNITLGNRNRLNFNTNLSYEIMDDFFLNFTFYAQYDSNPPDPNAAQIDWGNTTGLRYEFKSGQRSKRARKKRG